MICPKCGAVLSDYATTCDKCGAVLSASTKKPLPLIMDKKKRPKKRLVVILASIFVVFLLGIFLFPIILQTLNPKAYLLSCFKNTAEVYSEEWANTSEVLHLDSIHNLLESQPIETDYLLKAEQTPSLALLQGAGLNGKAQIDLQNRLATGNASLIYGSAQLASLQFSLDDDFAALSSPEFTSGNLYGVHTNSLGKDCEKAGINSISPDLSFNLFDILQSALSSHELVNEDTRVLLTQQFTHLFQQAQVRKDGSATQKVNGESNKLNMYTLSISNDVASKFLQSCANTILTDSQFANTITPIASSFGLSKSELNNKLDDMITQLNYGYFSSNLPVVIEINFGIRNKYIVFSSYSPANSELYCIELGNSHSLIDAYTVQIQNNKSTIILTSSGHHKLDNGVFTDKTEFTQNNNKLFSSALSFDNKSNEDNLTFTLTKTTQDTPFVLASSGSLQLEKEPFQLDLNSLRLQSGNQNLAFSLSLNLQKGSDVSMPQKDIPVITDLTSAQRHQLKMDIQNNAKQHFIQLLQSDSLLNGGLS